MTNCSKCSLVFILLLLGISFYKEIFEHFFIKAGKYTCAPFWQLNKTRTLLLNKLYAKMIPLKEEFSIISLLLLSVKNESKAHRLLSSLVGKAGNSETTWIINVTN